MSSPLSPSRARYRVVGMMVLLAMITYLDRACIAKLAPKIAGDLALSKIQMGYVFSAFALAYSLFEIPTAWLADRIGTRAVLTRIVVWWSAFTVLTGAAWSCGSMVAVRFLFGAGEAGAWPSVARTFSRWVPQRERGRVQGIFFAGAHLVGGLTPLIVGALLSFLSWRMVFAGCGLIGLAWAAVWRWWFRDEPADHPAVNPAELQLILTQRGGAANLAAPAGYWKGLLGDRNVWALCGMYFPNSFIFYFCITWLPTYLHERYHFEAAQLDFFVGLPLLLSVVGDLCGGAATDWLSAKFGLRIGRCGLGGLSYSLAGIALLATPLMPSPIAAALLISFAVALTMFTLAAAWGSCLDLAGAHAGVVSGIMNTAGQVGSLFCPLIVAYSLQWFGGWDVSLYFMGAMFLFGALCWALLDPSRPVFLPRPAFSAR